MNWRNYIEINDGVLSGKPFVKGTRISVEHIINLFASGWDENQILENYPRLTKLHLQAIFVYLQDIVMDDFIYDKSMVLQ